MHTVLKPALLAVLLATATQTYATGNIRNIYFFGDSLTDSGAFGGLAGLEPGARWTLGTADTHADVLARKLGLSNIANNPDNPNTSNSGNNYAQGGARSTTISGNTQTQSGLDVRDLPQQISQYLGNRSANRQSAYFVWAGGNDLAEAASNPGTAQAVTSTAAQSLGSQITLLQQAGARLIIAPNLPDFGATPAAAYAAIQAYALATGTAANLNNAIGAAWLSMSSNPTPDSATRDTIINNALTAAAAVLGGPATSVGLQTAYQQTTGSLNQLTSLFNLTVDGTLASQHTEVVRANVNALFKEVLANPPLYGIANTSGSACTPATSSLTCSTATIPGISYLFADDRHPTPSTHNLLGNYFASLLSAPYFAETLSRSATAASSHTGDVLDARYHTLAQAQRARGSVGAYTSISSGSQDAQGNGTHKGTLATVGMDYQVSPSLSMGMAFSQGTLDTRLGQAGKYDASHTQLSLTGQYRQTDWWLNADATLGVAVIDTQRHINLGTTQRTEQGNTRNVYQQLRLNAGYQWQLGQWQTGPHAGVSLMDGHIGAFTESGGSSTSMRYGKQKLDSQIVHAGWQASGKSGLFSPYFGISAKQELKDDAPILRTGLTSTSGDFSVTGSKPDSRWLAWQAGTNVTLGKGINGFLQATGTTGHRAANATRYQAGVAATF